MKKLMIGLLGALFASAAQAQTVPQYCNGAAVYDTAVLGSVKLVSAPAIGGIFVCGFTIASVASSTIGVKLTYSTAGVTATSTTGAATVNFALQNAITPAFQFVSPTSAQFLVDHPPSFGGLFVPSGNQLNLTTTANTGSIQAIIYYWTQNP